MTKNGKELLQTIVEADLAAAVRQEASDKAVSIAAVLRWALMDRYDRQRQEAEARQMPVSVVSP